MDKAGSVGETLGVVTLSLSCFAMSFFITGILKYIASILGAGILGLWIVRYLLEGAANAYEKKTETDVSASIDDQEKR